ncbi:MAG: hypothetical protein JSU65_03625, partial [Candidatus Zixiibacteriota bacterium]
YTVIYGEYRDSYTFRTAPLPGSRLPFTFAYTSDGRANYGGGERDLHGTNAYMLKRIGVACVTREARFLQYTGDLIGGYSSSYDNMMLQYANWKRAADPFACYIPFVVGIGNHESLSIQFRSDDKRVAIDRFPYTTHSTEAVFAANFVNPHNGPSSEDGSEYDPDPQKEDFPPYDETVFYYTYDNVAMIVLNSAYWYSPGSSRSRDVGGNLRGYIMDNQLAWLRETLEFLENDQNIDHVFVTLHGPIFPNAGYIKGAMWHRGSNEPRPTVAGKPVRKGIIECRDELLDAIMNHSSKVVATLTGHEHSYSLLRVSEDMPMYLDDYQGSRLSNVRPFWHITNGAGGAPYYGPEETIWQEHLHKFSTQNALVLFHVQGKEIRAEVLNPDTMELIQEFDL